MKPLKVWMKVCEHYGPSISNVAEKYVEYAPDERVEWVDDWIDADVMIDHLIGTPDRANLVNPLERSFSEDVKARLEVASMMPEKNVAYVMHCAIVDDEFYRKALEECIVSTGFLDIEAIILAPHDGDPVLDGYYQENVLDKWLRVAWGVDPADFLLPVSTEDKEYTIYTWGASGDPEEEYIRSIYEAVKRMGGKMLHSGLDYRFDTGEHYHYVPPAHSKKEVAQRYNKCRFANAMRREDGFELANIEAPLANAVPITLSTGSYKHFFGGLSLLVDPERDVVEQLVTIFRENHPSPTMQYKRRIIERFNWQDTTKPFWDRTLAWRKGK
jgi:hypothetical protein